MNHSNPANPRLRTGPNSSNNWRTFFAPLSFSTEEIGDPLPVNSADQPPIRRRDACHHKALQINVVGAGVPPAAYDRVGMERPLGQIGTQP